MPMTMIMVPRNSPFWEGTVVWKNLLFQSPRFCNDDDNGSETDNDKGMCNVKDSDNFSDNERCWGCKNQQ